MADNLKKYDSYRILAELDGGFTIYKTSVNTEKKRLVSLCEFYIFDKVESLCHLLLSCELYSFFLIGNCKIL